MRLTGVRIGLPLLAFVVYWFSAPRTITLEDAGLFQMTCQLGGFGHPPGYPLFALACQALFLLPVDNPILLGNLISAFYAAVAVGLLFEVCRQLGLNLVSSLFAASTYALSGMFWSQAIIIEVYSLNAMLFMASLWLCLRYQQGGSMRDWYALVLVVSLSLANHWPLIILSGPSLLLILLQQPERFLTPLRQWYFSLLLVLAGLSPYLLLLQSAPTISLAGPLASLSEFVSYISRSVYELDDSFIVAGAKWPLVGWLVKELMVQPGLAGWLLLPVGLIISFQQLPRLVFIALLYLLVAHTLLLLALVPFEDALQLEAIFYPYPSTGILVFAIWLGCLAQQLFKSRLSSSLVYLVLAMVLAQQFLYQFPSNYRKDAQLVDAWGRTVLALTPPNAILLARGDAQTGVLGYLHYVAGEREDIKLMQWDGLFYPDRAIAPYASRATRQAGWGEFLSQADTAIFSVKPYLSPAAQLGLGYQLSAEPQVLLHPRAEQFLDYLLAIYPNRHLLHVHEQILLFELLQEYALQYYRLRIQAQLPDQRAPVLQHLSETFAGKIALVLNQPELADFTSRDQLLDTVDNVLNQPEFQLLSPQRADLLRGAAAIALLRPADQTLARKYLERSIYLFDDPRNPSHCELARLDGEPERC